MYNFRYHIASLVAVFLALATGLVLGTVVVERGVLDKQRTTLVGSLQTDYNRLRTENTALKQRADTDRSLAAQMMPTMVGASLKGRRMIVLTDSGQNPALSATRDALRMADAEVVVASVETTGFGTAGATAAKALSARVTVPPGGSLADAVADAVAAEWSRPAPGPISDALVGAGQLTFEGPQPDKPLDGLVLLASWNGQADPALIRLASALSRVGVKVVSAETGSAPGAVSGSLSAGLSTVDDVETPQGVLSLVYVLAGKAQGHFGSKPGATDAFPPIR